MPTQSSVLILGSLLLATAARAAQDNGTSADTNKLLRLPEATVRDAALAESKPVGPYQQPEWTTARRFPTTRVYVQNTPWDISVEQWWRYDDNKDGSTSHLFEEECEIGLPHRFQLDLYHSWVNDTDHSTRHDGFAVEGRYALADWGKIPGNPTFYGEWKFVNEGPDTCEGKLLLGDEIARRWHWGVNLILEQEVGGERTLEKCVSQALSYTVLDEKLSVGYEWKYAHESVAGERGTPERSLLAGPSLQWRPTRNTHLDIVPMFGVTHDAPRIESFVVFGVDFGGPGHKTVQAPVSSMRD